MGSQISNVRDIANGMREAVRYFVELLFLSTLGWNQNDYLISNDCHNSVHCAVADFN